MAPILCHHVITNCTASYEQLDNTQEQANQRLCLLEQRETRIRELEASVAEAGAELERCNARLHEKEQDNVHWQEKFGIADREMALMESEMKEIEGKNQRLEKDVHQLQKQCKNLKQDLDKERRRADQDADQREREYEIAVSDACKNDYFAAENMVVALLKQHNSYLLGSFI